MAKPKLPVQTASPRAAIIGLVIACAAWGWTFPAMKWAVEIMAHAEPKASQPMLVMIFMALRFPLGALFYLVLTFRSQSGYTKEDIKVGFVTGSLAGIGMIFQFIGLMYVYPSVSGFLTALSVITLPIAESVLMKKGVSWKLWLACLLALGGLVVMSLGAGGSGSSVKSEAPFPFFGEALTVLASLFFTAQILLLGHWGKGTNPQRVTLTFLMAVGAINLLAIMFWSDAQHFIIGGALTEAYANPTFKWTFYSTVFISTVIAFHFMNSSQPKVSATLAGVVYCMEPVFASLFSLALGAEEFRWSLGLGGGLILIASLIAATQTSPVPAAPEPAKA